VRAAGLREAPVVVLGDLEALTGVSAPLVRYQPPPRFPGVAIDLNVTVPPRTEAAAVLAGVPSTPDLKRAEVVDVWPLEAGARLTLRFAFNAGERSMTHDEAMAQVGTIRAALDAAGWAVG
jgi:phenylalanyl-tRNA synthetase beta subunit